MIRAVILDFDGVLLESAQIKTDAFRALFRDLCPERVDDAVACHTANEGISRFVKFRMVYDEILKQPLSAQQEQALGRRFEALVRGAVLRAPLVPGALEFLRAARGGAWRVFVASGTPREELRRLADARQLTAWAEEWHGSPPGKPQIIRDILQRHRLSPSEAVMVGDAVSDLRAAEETSVAFIGRCAGADGRFEKCGQWISDLRQLPDVLRRLAPSHQQGGGA